MESQMSRWNTLAVEFLQHSTIYRPAAILNSLRDARPRKGVENKRQKSRRQNFNTRIQHVDVIICELWRSQETILLQYPYHFFHQVEWIHESFLLFWPRFVFHPSKKLNQCQEIKLLSKYCLMNRERFILKMVTYYINICTNSW